MDYRKLAPGLTVALQTYRHAGTAGLNRHSRTFGVASGPESTGPTRLPVFVICDEFAGLDNLQEQGVVVHQKRGKIRTASLPIESLDALSERTDVRRILPSQRLRPLLDLGSLRCQVAQFRAGALDGQGVLVGVVDTGIDPHHPAFQGRILRIWDQTLQGTGVQEGGYGRELTGQQLTRSRDLDGHGTHVAGIAAGADGNFGGIAPAAELVIVKTDFQNTRIADAIRYISRIAAEANRPVVINLSLGGHFDAHDGTDPLSLVVDEVSGPGRILCCAAGNEGNDNIHGQVEIPPGESRSMRFRVPSGMIRTALLNGWYAGNGALEVSLRTPGGFVTAAQGIIAAGDPSRRYTLADGTVVVSTPPPDLSNGDHNFVVDLGPRPPGQRVTGGVWRLVLRNVSQNPVRVDVWTLDDQDAPEVTFSGQSVRDSIKIGSPGAAASAVTVASFTTRVQWNDVDQSAQEVGLVLDDISDFSSEGPLRNGQPKPDIAAPGAMIVSCLSADSQASRAVMVNEDFRVNAGTSMATPFIAGIVALLLQRDPTLAPHQVKDLLRTNSAIPNRPAGVHDPKWGFGLLAAEAL